ncbi:MAG: polysaccharide biosynthesis C-terminal domain-containing protein, partial [candidate division Zixibacteria bacterium]|nr:polysaccharide biosynthesis C-terminal domain-containing protein [candidate division Zixibacteria bacterium]
FIQKKTKYNPLIIGISAIFNLLMNYLLIPPYGMLGAAVASFSSYLLMDLLAYLINLRIYPIPYEGVRILKIIIVTILLFFVLNQIQISSWKGELLYKLSILPLFPLLLWVSGFFTSNELRRAKNFMPSLLEKLKLKKVN